MKLSPDVLALNPSLKGRALSRPPSAEPVEASKGRLSLRLDKLHPEPKFRSNTERRAWREWLPGQGAVAAFYELITVRLPGGNYTPDFDLLMPDGELWLVEVKGSWNAYQSGRSSKKSLKEAAKTCAWLGRWFSLMPARTLSAEPMGELVEPVEASKGEGLVGGWQFEEVNP